jgi:hypothetical protein
MEPKATSLTHKYWNRLKVSVKQQNNFKNVLLYRLHQGKYFYSWLNVPKLEDSLGAKQRGFQEVL